MGDQSICLVHVGGCTAWQMMVLGILAAFLASWMYTMFLHRRDRERLEKLRRNQFLVRAYTHWCPCVRRPRRAPCLVAQGGLGGAWAR